MGVGAGATRVRTGHVSTGSRYAIYFTPEDDSSLGRFGWWWLGRHPTSEDYGVLPAFAVEAARHSEVVAEPRLYGFHATLKPPFHLAEGSTEAGLLDALVGFADECAAFSAPALHLGNLHGFLALLPSAPAPEFERLAAACVREFDGFRAPPTEVETAKRLQAGLTERQQELLAEWGYPYVFDEFRFHMTLTCSLDDAEQRIFKAILEPLVAGFTHLPLAVGSLCLFRQSAAGKPFVMLQRFNLGAT